jgi:hypothetical protein
MPPQITPGHELSATPPEGPCQATVRLELFASDEERGTVDVVYRIVRPDVRVAFLEPQGPSPLHRKAEDVVLVDTGATVFPVPVEIRASLVAPGAADDSAPFDSTTTTFFALAGGQR